MHLADSLPTPAAPKRVVIKIGGSLLDLPDLRPRLAAILESCEPACVALVAGGGALADEVRHWFDRQALDEGTAHALAMQTLEVTASLLVQLLPGAELCHSAASVREAWERGRTAVIQPNRWFQQSRGWFDGPPRLSSGLLPQTWDVTSDTLAACIAIELNAGELLLLKSADSPAGLDLASAAEAGLVDRCLPRIADRIPRIRWVNLRTSQDKASEVDGSQPVR